MKNIKFDWGFGVVFLLGGFIIFILTLIFLADESGDLVSDDYYEDALTYQVNHIEARQRNNQLKEQPNFTHQANGILLSFPNEVKVDSGVVYLMRGAFQKDDISIPINLNDRNQILIPAAKLVPGEYDASITWFYNQKPYLKEETLQWTSP